eukprot:3854429-Pyramimonas_sp.AAC.1
MITGPSVAWRSPTIAASSARGTDCRPLMPLESEPINCTKWTRGRLPSHRRAGEDPRRAPRPPPSLAPIRMPWQPNFVTL